MSFPHQKDQDQAPRIATPFPYPLPRFSLHPTPPAFFSKVSLGKQQYGKSMAELERFRTETWDELTSHLDFFLANAGPYTSEPK